MKKIFFVALGLMMVQPVWAAKVSLNSGVTVEGAILNAASDSIKVDVSGVPVTYYKDEIAAIEGDEGAAQALGLRGTTPPVAVEPVPVSAEPVVQQGAVAPVVDNAPIFQAPVAPAVGPEDPVEKKALILRFIEVFGTRQTMTQNFNQMMTALPPDQAEKLRKAFNVEDIIQQLIPLYDKYFTMQDLQAYNEFYGSVKGQKLIQTIPRIMKDSVAVSAKYFETRMPEELKNMKMPAAPKAPAVK